MIRISTSSAEETRALAARVAAHAAPGDLVLLVGELGAGKTTFAQGFGAALGVAEAITSPTFTLAREYKGRIPLHHLDVYRLEQIEEVLDLALPELLDSGAVTLIEWGEAILPALPPDYLEVRFEYGPGDDDRVVSFAVVGPRWSVRHRALAAMAETEH